MRLAAFPRAGRRWIRHRVAGLPFASLPLARLPLVSAALLGLAVWLAAPGSSRAQDPTLLGEVLRPETRLSLGVTLQELGVDEGSAGEQSTSTKAYNTLGILDLKYLRLGALAQGRDLRSESSVQTNRLRERNASAVALLTLGWIAYGYSQEGEYSGFRAADTTPLLNADYAYDRTGSAHSLFLAVYVLRLGYSHSTETLNFRLDDGTNPRQTETYGYVAVSRDVALVLPFKPVTFTLSTGETETPRVHGNNGTVFDYHRRTQYNAFEAFLARATLRLTENTSQVKFTSAVTVRQVVRGADFGIVFTPTTTFTLGYSHTAERRNFTFVTPSADEKLKLVTYTLGVQFKL